MSAVFPAVPLGVMTELFLGAWTDISTEVYQRDPISCTLGKPDESSQVNPSSSTFTLNNTGNQFSINNPMGPYYGLLGRNTPVRHSVPNSLLPAPHNTSYLRMEDDAVSSANSASASQLEITGSIDVRIDMTLSGYGSWVLAGRWGGSWQFGINTSGQLTLRYTPDGVTSFNIASSIQAPLPIGRQVIRFTFDTSAGLVTFYTAAPGNISSGPWTQLGASQPILSALTLNAGTIGLSVGSFTGAVYDMQLRNGINGTLVAHPGFNTLSAGTTSWTDSTGLSWSLSGTATISNRSYRYHGELAQTPKAADPSGTDVYSQATANGVLRRLGQAQNPINSPMYRAYVRQTGASAPIAYWPCEDASLSTQLASGLPGGIGMQISGTPQIAGNSACISSAPLPTLNGATFRGVVPQQASTPSFNTMQLIAVFPASPTSETNNEVVGSIFTNGTVARMDFVYGTGGTGTTAVVGYNSAGTQLFNSGPFFVLGDVVNGNPILISFGLQTSGSSVEWTMFTYGPSASAGGLVSGTVSGSIGATTSVAINTGGQCQQVAAGHVAVLTTASNAGSLQPPFNAWAGETAANRVQRLCTEEGINCRIVGHPELSVQMGNQTLQTVPDLLQECEATDRGMLFEPRTCLGIGYRTLFSMYNQPPKASVSYSAQQLGAAFASTTDDLLTLNDVTVSNADGSAARQVLLTGTMSVQSPPNGVGRVDTEIEVNALSDGYLAGIAQWILHVSTDGHDRFPAIPFDLARPQTPASVATLDIGDLAVITSPPTWLQPDEIDQLAAGFTETLGPFGVWTIDVNGIPAYPYTVATVAPALSSAATFTGGGFAMHVDTDGTTLNAAVSSTATGLSFATAAGYPAWTKNPADYPFDVNIAGERITVAGPGTCLGTDPLLQQGAAKYSGGNGVLTLSTAVGAPYPATGYGTSALLLTPAGGNAFADIAGVNSAPGSVALNTSHTLWAWVYSPTGRSLNLLVNWALNGTYVSTSTVAPAAVPAGVWTLISGTVTSPASGVNMGAVGVEDGSSPTSAQVFYTWGANRAPTASITATSPQTMTGMRSVNGVVKSQASGAGVTLWYRPVVGQITGA